MYLRTTDLCVMHLGCKFNYEVPIATKLVLLLTNVRILVLARWLYTYLPRYLPTQLPTVMRDNAMQCLIVAQEVYMYVQHMYLGV